MRKADLGKRLLQFFVEGPVRLAPAIHNKQVLFGSDDGYLYSLNASDGTLRWKTRLSETDRRLPGNQRVVSLWPIRTNPWIDDTSLYICSGLMPVQGVICSRVEPGDRTDGKRELVRSDTGCRFCDKAMILKPLKHKPDSRHSALGFYALPLPPSLMTRRFNRRQNSLNVIARARNTPTRT